MTHFTYKDNSKATWDYGVCQSVAPVIFECDEELLTEADKLFEKALGYNPAKKPHVVCSCKKIS